MFLSSHNEVMRVVLVIHNVLQVNTRFLIQFLKKPLVKNKSDPADLLHACLRLGPFVNKIRRYRYGQFTAKLLSLEAFQCVPLAVGTDQNVKFVLRYRMIGRRSFRSPTDF